MARAKHQRKVSGNPAKRGSAQAPPPAPVTFRDWVGAARLRTLPLAVSPVLIGTGAAVRADPDHLFHWVIALACLAVAVALQIGVNFANDYSDGIRGTDDDRIGPARLTASGRVTPRAVLTAALIFFGIAAVAGLAIVIRTGQWWLIAVGAVCIVAAWFYTGGKRPYGYNALGEVFVFVFFGLVATLGTTWVQALQLSQEAWFGAIAAGLLACAVLLANNLRDIDQDRVVGKRTLTVLIGRVGTKILYTLFVVVAYGIVLWMAYIAYPMAWLVLLSLLLLGPALLIVWTYRKPGELVPALALTSIGSLVFGAILAWAYVA
ncbi:1,4-dihydroxy-2-naphthoate polyprenyltransferase [Microbacterium halophytorum]|uniref:1,4-dihydroxy-2-naphthoate polyprenyltransferase n=1 Tax=Microbacterium halophytorum TaxID=2067568 RepID=UPI001E3052C9|nr:1,4-dihydroxy-2-naphthoate polyprenyltransferase [Microbacterium halophytorum]